MNPRARKLIVTATLLVVIAVVIIGAIITSN